ncbi:helix-turn-helix domain-containing protein [Lactobacillus kalixensis]|uniref:Transcriptional regulator, XRE family protein n=1 Tax=Lactobacillus kalixensis DSM 16043 TaxID=1423763 RepID=A0A0R1UJ10_9LACO|nr:helix-turn-helix transcriptional regulator [Lactobacillus kalixensis]KRL90853.1 transcriptional regulator, XRE family protein [Lactobacillus kalixensis DSM 16043]
MSVNLGVEISRRRRDQRLTQEDLAELSDLSVNFISRLERTKDQNISIQKLDSIAQALNTTTPDIINNAYRVKKVYPNGPTKETNPAYIQKIVNEIRKLPSGDAEKVSKSLIVLLKTMNNNK